MTSSDTVSLHMLRRYHFNELTPEERTKLEAALAADPKARDRLAQIRTSEEALKAVPQGYREVSYSLGTGKWQTVVHAVLPRAIPGILTGIILSIGRCVGETAAVIFTAGSALGIPHSLMDSTRTMSVHFYILAREGISEANAYGTAVVLVISILIINIAAYTLMHRYIKKRS